MCGLPFLSVAVDSAVPLLEDHKRPGDIEMDQLMAEEMEVETFARDVGREQQAHWSAVATEVLNHFLKIDVFDAGAMDHGHLFGLQLQIAGEVLRSRKCKVSIRSVKRTIRSAGLAGIPVQKATRLQHLHQALVLGEVAGTDTVPGPRRCRPA